MDDQQKEEEKFGEDWSVPEELSDTKSHMRLTPYILARLRLEFNSLILETVRGEHALDVKQVEELIARLQKIQKAMTHLEQPRILRLRPIQQVLHTLKFMNRLDKVLLISLKDPNFRINASDLEDNEIQRLLTLLDKSNELRLPSGARSEAKRLGSMMMYKSKIPPHHLLILISSDEKSMLETRNLQEIEETIRLLSRQLESMLKTPISKS